MDAPAQPHETNPAREHRAGPVRLSLRMLRLHQGCDNFSGKLIYLMVVFSPWAFGTTQPWSIWTMNSLGYLLGILLGIKLAIRQWTGYLPARWGETNVTGRNDNARLTQWLIRTLAGTTLLLLAYCLIGVINARSTYHPAAASFEYHRFISWLPNSHDRRGGWLAFCNYLALALSFWALRDWLLGKSLGEERTERSPLNIFGLRGTFVLPERLRRLLWVLCLNGGLLGIEGIMQRLAGTNQLLFLMPTRINKMAAAQFGPFAYRSNAAQYFNLVWPACLGLWWTLQPTGAGPEKSNARRNRHLIPVCVMIMAAAPIISTTRAGAIVAVVQLVLATFIFWFARPQEDIKAKMGVLLFTVLTLGFGIWLGWATLAPHFEPEVFQSDLAGRNNMYVTARQMTVDYPLFGTGPGTFEPLFQLYRVDPNEYWPAQLHNDWLQTLITFGWLGSGMIGLALGCVLLRWFIPGGIGDGRRLALLLWVSLGGCLLHARYDFPFQICSVLFLFLLLCAILSCLSHRSSR
jgi:O-antigen ligase